MEESKQFLNPYDNVVRVVILIIGINKIIMNNLFLIDFNLDIKSLYIHKENNNCG